MATPKVIDTTREKAVEELFSRYTLRLQQGSSSAPDYRYLANESYSFMQAVVRTKLARFLPYRGVITESQSEGTHPFVQAHHTITIEDIPDSSINLPITTGLTNDLSKIGVELYSNNKYTFSFQKEEDFFEFNYSFKRHK